jgi:hypothetical protein
MASSGAEAWYAAAVAADDRLVSRRGAVTTAERERAIAVLSDGFAQGELAIEEFEERITLAHRATTTDDLAKLTADLAVPAPPAPGAEARVSEQVASVPDQATAVAIFGGARRHGAWQVPRHLRVTAVFGGVEIDLREARLPNGPIDFEVTATFGGVQIIVPPSLAIEVHGSAILGGFDHLDRVAAAPDPGAPVLRVHGTALLGGVSVETRLPGESARVAHRRRRRERRRERHRRRLPE